MKQDDDAIVLDVSPASSSRDLFDHPNGGHTGKKTGKGHLKPPKMATQKDLAEDLLKALRSLAGTLRWKGE